MTPCLNLYFLLSIVVLTYIIPFILFLVPFWLPFLFLTTKVEGKNLEGSNVKGTNKLLAFLMWIYMGQIAWKRGHRSPHRRGGPTSVMPTGQNFFI
jgi:hypothetical protein